MSFQPNAGDEITIDDIVYRIAGHPSAPGMPYGQEGRQGIVYQLIAPSPASGEGRGGGPGHRALKVFKSRYRVPGLVALADHIGSFATLSGLAVCSRSVLTPRRHGGLLHEHADLVYAVVMPWIEGPTWMEVMLDKRELSPEQSLDLSRSLVDVLVALEQRSMAHCDLSGPNVLLPALAERDDGKQADGAVALVDVEQLYAPGLERPELLPGGSLGYAQHRTATEGLWETKADRFSGAVLVAEILGWCDGRVREAAWGENYFDPDEMQREGERAKILAAVLGERWGIGVAGLFERAWRSETLADCATFGEWSVILPETPPFPAQIPASPVENLGTADGEAQGESVAVGADSTVQALLGAARQLEQQRDVVAALEVYRQAQAMIPAGSGLAQELALIVTQLQAQSSAPTAAKPLGPASTTAPPIDPEVELAGLFDEGREAYQRGEWARARELLGEVVRREPGYMRGKQRADRLLAQAEKRLAPRRRISLSLGRVWRPAAIVLAGAIALPAILFGSVSLGGQVGSLFSAPSPTPVPAKPTTAPAAANPVAKPATAPIAAATPTPTVDQIWQAALGELEGPWDEDWPKAIAMVDAFRQRFGGYRPADDKLYAALLAYAQQLVQEGNRDRAVEQLLRAQALLPARGEAPTALAALTQVTTPEPVPEPAAEPAPGPGTPAQQAPAQQAPAPRAPAPQAPAPQPPSAPPPRPLRP